MTYGTYSNLNLTEVVEVSTYRECYDWRVLGVWWHEETNSYRVSTDGGCSCNSPWEYLKSLEDYGPPLTYVEARTKIQKEDFDPDCFSEKLDAIERLVQFERNRQV
ncbi:hypothetical protein PBI_REDNO2_118 [Mycobacterium phage Redno2]|uniref:DUF7574 domain-containing protein n=1 Tax=Mycobacterium phage Thibault TaxID=1052673 RepID=G1FGH3_9CAUD|nr:hypothetical protein N860_gp118 [Mycobacterium phage Redno2]YP_009018119.1 hypothetical protein CL87_gp108 [Mycobacterium phage Thibault]QBJ00074.1 hypothetical protein SEA_PHOEBUS_127 [Mycobacterium phage Phoebus]QDM55702.1 hypothetical protein SEA_HOKKEND_116 [Mycobacterium phage HokkenD]QZD97999.1 hypothetical protein SEA_BEEM_128 [Mycobacterium phage Beem]UEM46609.1 hypothetical protein SEA_JUICYJAY_123 [Mycobacterium phage JuicyJay]AEJ94031.1 hypothetical protein THIBAULT_108 [Mycobac